MIYVIASLSCVAPFALVFNEHKSLGNCVLVPNPVKTPESGDFLIRSDPVECTVTEMAGINSNRNLSQNETYS